MTRNSLISDLISAFKWLFLRMPRPFSVTFAIISLIWVFYLFHVTHQITSSVINHFSNKPVLSWRELFYPDFGDVEGIVFAVVSLLTFVVGFVVAYNVSTWVNNRFFKQRSAKPLNGAPGRTAPSEPREPLAPFSQSTRIGIALAGGGAKGAYQAGALTAIYEFLRDRNALNNVKAISGTSIGSWNAVFWLADMIKSPDHRGPGALEWWWRRLNAADLVAPHYFLPGRSNCFLTTEPWRWQFDQLFGSDEIKKRLFNTDVHFYMTRLNVRNARLECATNNAEPSDRNRIAYDRLKTSRDPDEFFDRMKTAVFASMDLPPLFPYMKHNDQLYEDGGIIENIPLRFPATENCDLIFVLPLNSDFETEPNSRSLVARIGRVMDVQQGALERHGFKLLNLYNENAALRDRIRELSPNDPAGQVAVDDPLRDSWSPLLSALQRKNKPIKIFAVCPDKSFVQTTINTRDLWNAGGAGEAFNIMRTTTSHLLDNFDFTAPQQRPQIARILKSGASLKLDI